MNVAYRRRKPSHLTETRSFGLILGAIGLAAGTAWCLRNHGGSGSYPFTERRAGTSSHQRNWLLGALGAGLAGAAVGVARTNTGNMDARAHPGSGDVRLASHVGPTIEWDAEVVDDDPGKLLAWRSLEGSELQTWGTVIFRPRDAHRGTEVSVAFNFCPTARATGVVAGYLAGLENAVLDRNLKNLKAQLEADDTPILEVK